jgi:acyl-CoA reductase-like NAD-dependent aldehyde dehydrogenase
MSESIHEQTEECKQAQLLWSELPLRTRLKIVRDFRHKLVSNWRSLCGAVESDIGRPMAETLAVELMPLAAACKSLERSAAKVLRPRRIPLRHRPLWLGRQSDTVFRRPRGIVGIIGTWNYPHFLNGVQIAQALAAGNGVIWKPSELASASAAAMCDVLAKLEIPAGLFQSLPATREAGQQLAEADVDHIVFTGSAATGRQLAARLGQRLVSSTLELSGCDALFVLEDADVQLAAEAAIFGALLNGGQTCLAARRVFVHESLYTDFAARLKSLAADTPPARLALASQASQAQRLIASAIAEGARLLEATPAAQKPNASILDSSQNLYPLQVIMDARPQMAVCQEASFAPLVAVMQFRTIEEALEMDSQCPYGLGASIFTSDLQRARNLAEKLKVGIVTINDLIAPTAHPGTPIIGRRASGWGATQGLEGLLEMTVPQVVSVRRGKFRPHFPSSDPRWRHQDVALGTLQWSYGAKLGERFRGLWRTIRGLTERPGDH